ncbi:MAG: hypothetical protein HQ582_13250, partial [Planctomycetes bacterium]|nr:hypothetical protein [Planctomycetota bacterium]
LDREREEIERQLTPLLTRRHELQTALADREALEFRLESAETPQATDAAKKALAAHEGAQKQFDAVDERYRATQDELRAIRERIERHSAAMFDWRTVGFLTLDEEETVKARAEKSQLAFRAGSGLVSHPGGTLVGG